jgi:ferric enterobactin receptor
MYPSSALFVAACFALLPAVMVAQVPVARGELRGSVVAASTNQPLFSAAVVIRGGASVADTSRAGSTSVRADGTFHLSGLRPGYYTVYVRAIGYVPVTRTGVIIRSSGDTIDVGQISLVGVAIQLGSVRVAEDRDATALAPDRNTYATKDLPAAAGGTAIDLLRNVPQVEVDADNNVALRGGECQDSCRMSCYCTAHPSVPYVGLSVSVAMGEQSRVAPLLRLGCWTLVRA